MVPVVSRFTGLLIAAVLCAPSLDLAAQGRGAGATGRSGGQARGMGGRGGQRQMPPEGLTPRQVQAEFDKYAIDQAQDALQLSDEQYPQFVRHFGTLQQVRRQTRAQRLRLLNQITQLLRTRPSVDDGRIAAATRAIDEHERSALAEVQRAYAAVDEVLTPRQRARFRVLEDRLEQRKLDMLFRAGQGPRR